MPIIQGGKHVALSPVDAAGSGQPRPGVALCLSGGGYRAMIFLLGVLWRLNELGYLVRLDRISSVSGSSITAALLGRPWRPGWSRRSVPLPARLSMWARC